MTKEKETVHIITLVMDKKDWEKVKIIASKEDRSTSAQVRIAIKNHIHEWESK
jgi:hypothetical protein